MMPRTVRQELSQRVLEQGGDYFWVLKDNQPGVKEAVSLLFAEPPWGESFAGASQEGRHGDRWESRRLWASAALNGYLDWPGTGTGLLCGAKAEAQGQGDAGASVCHNQPDA